MQYLIFGILLLIGTLVLSVLLYTYHSKNKVAALVVESYCDFKKDGQHIETMDVTHVFEFEIEGDKKRIETKILPVRELSGATVNLYYDKEREDLYIPDYQKYIPLFGTFILAGMLCIFLFLVQIFGLFDYVTDREWIVLLLAVIGVISFSHVHRLISTAVIKTKGNFDGMLMSENGAEVTEIYSLWYGEHRQYAKRVRGMWLKKKDSHAVTLFFNTKTGTVYRMQELVFHLCLSILAFALMIVIVVIDK